MIVYMILLFRFGFFQWTPPALLGSALQSVFKYEKGGEKGKRKGVRPHHQDIISSARAADQTAIEANVSRAVIMALQGKEDLSDVPYGEPYWYGTAPGGGGSSSPYYTARHEAFRAKVRAFVDNELLPYVHEWDEKGAFPDELHRKAYAAGIYGAAWPAEHGGTPPPGGFDAFHDLILADELARCGCGGVLWSCFQSFGISLPPVLAAGRPELIQKVAR